ncbi:MAG: bifunctional diaminohydroxyphosphoribosylaminopyrimidine deaminase/5-amino-6-(5-phosphoribosylamino)uracil reductase RibD [Culturomica sp.]|jgi:diaminohydroxyphosphoribosylaminopyrimidine deaminase/5-amino-6-(5-phosphoribosylamino)uracil reductase|nr:bifunctional diaminohydroxyphosphoribosylaminopyrimidine deaminase/5-amino-6-(5-phosphoribosylamino)uracil reductase RibD [Culturomica sp.]
MVTEEDRKYIGRAAELAEHGKGFVNPNPLVGAVIVREGRIIGEGFHARCGGPHAEREAFRNCTEDPRGATLYVTLEPCCHYGKTPPCTEIILEKGIARVVIGLTDPNPLVAGKGIAILQNAGIAVESGVEVERLTKQNRVFLKYITTRTPWVVLKTAMTLDGKIATYTGDSKWVTGEEARKEVHRMRAEYTGIVAGSGTVKADDPLLNCRGVAGCHQPVRIVVDSAASLPVTSRIFRTAKEQPVILAHTAKAGAEKLETLQAAGIETLLCTEQEGKVSIPDLLRKLGEKQIDSLLLEGGGELNASFLNAGMVDEVVAFIAPKLTGGREAPTPVEGKGIARMNEAIRLREVESGRIGEDIRIRGVVEHRK